MMCGTIDSLPDKQKIEGLLARKGNDGFVFFWPPLLGMEIAKIDQMIKKVNLRQGILSDNYHWVGSKTGLRQTIIDLNKYYGLPGIKISENSTYPQAIAA